MVLRPPLTSLGTHVCCFSLASAAMCRRLLSGKWVPTLLLKDPHTHPQFRVTLWWKTIFHCRTLVATCVLNFPFRNHCFSAFSILFSLLFVFFFYFWYYNTSCYSHLTAHKNALIPTLHWWWKTLASHAISDQKHLQTAKVVVAIW